MLYLRFCVNEKSDFCNNLHITREEKRVQLSQKLYTKERMIYNHSSYIYFFFVGVNLMYTHSYTNTYLFSSKHNSAQAFC